MSELLLGMWIDWIFNDRYKYLLKNMKVRSLFVFDELQRIRMIDTWSPIPVIMGVFQ